MRLQTFHDGRLLAAIDLCVTGLREFCEGEADIVDVPAGGGRQAVEGGEDLLRFMSRACRTSLMVSSTLVAAPVVPLTSTWRSSVLRRPRR